jgi:hypothetical protein
MKKSAMLILVAGIGMWMTAGAFGLENPPAPPQPPTDATPDGPQADAVTPPPVPWDCPLGNQPMGWGPRDGRGMRGKEFGPMRRGDFPAAGRGMGMRPGGRGMMRPGGRGMGMNRADDGCPCGCPYCGNIGRIGPGLGVGRMQQGFRGDFRGGRQWAAPDMNGGREWVADDARGMGRRIGRDFGNQAGPGRQGRGTAFGDRAMRPRDGYNMPERKQLRDGSCQNQTQPGNRRDQLNQRIEQLHAQLQELEARLDQMKR